MNGLKLELTKEARLLGFTLDSKLTWKPHITRNTRKVTTVSMQCRQIVGKTRGNKTIYDEMDIHSYDTSNHVVCMCVLGRRSQQKMSSEETHKDAETCLHDDFISFSWHPTDALEILLYSTLLPSTNSYWPRQCEGHTESLFVGSSMLTELVPLGKRKAMLMLQ